MPNFGFAGKGVFVKLTTIEIKENPLIQEPAVESMKRNRYIFFLPTSACSLSFARGKRATGFGPTTPFLPIRKGQVR